MRVCTRRGSAPVAIAPATGAARRCGCGTRWAATAGDCLLDQPCSAIEGRCPGHDARRSRSYPRTAFAVPLTECESAAREVLLECAANYSPRIEETRGEAYCACVLDIAGTKAVWASRCAQRIRVALAGAGFRTSVAVSMNFHTALLKARVQSRGGCHSRRTGDGCAGASAARCAQPAGEGSGDTCDMGRPLFGELATLPEVELIARLGQDGKRWRDIASGTLSHQFQPLEPQFSLREFCEFEWALELVDPLLFVAARMIDSLVTRATGHALSLALLNVTLRLEGGRSHQLTLRPALPTTDRKFLLKLLQIELAAHPPQSAIAALTIAAEAGRSSTVQLRLSCLNCRSLPPRCDTGAFEGTGRRGQGWFARA